MKKVDYSLLPTDVLKRDMADHERNLELLERYVKEFHQNLAADNGIDYTASEIEHFQGYINDAPRSRAKYEKCIGQIKAELASR